MAPRKTKPSTKKTTGTASSKATPPKKLSNKSSTQNGVKKSPRRNTSTKATNDKQQANEKAVVTKARKAQAAVGKSSKPLKEDIAVKHETTENTKSSSNGFASDVTVKVEPQEAKNLGRAPATRAAVSKLPNPSKTAQCAPDTVKHSSLPAVADSAVDSPKKIKMDTTKSPVKQPKKGTAKNSKFVGAHMSILPHGSYLLNCGSPDAAVLEKSRATLVDELKRCEMLGLVYYNFHPGSTCGVISREACMDLIAESINQAHKETTYVISVIENMCNQGNTIGGDFHELRGIIDRVKDKSRIGVCLDTCHAFAAGYDLATQEGFEKMMSDFESIIGLSYLKALHLNDSKGSGEEEKLVSGGGGSVPPFLTSTTTLPCMPTVAEQCVLQGRVARA
ncbi:hypothetical protein HPB50_001742 [Hyalomma asiaticum]|uniref:Uncharacterized protein n=1 Tax=Hyalomma asiaticum TaxID=266040 RepID=A0ACB7T5F3_HYAAI|nr:hypothetical protein HPB50_001742 [Hyalomma asiaticum]